MPLTDRDWEAIAAKGDKKLARISIQSQIVAQGSFGLVRINPENGVRIGDTITVWHAFRAGERLGTFLTRQRAREFVRSVKRKS